MPQSLLPRKVQFRKYPDFMYNDTVTVIFSILSMQNKKKHYHTVLTLIIGILDFECIQMCTSEVQVIWLKCFSVYIITQ